MMTPADADEHCRRPAPAPLKIDKEPGPNSTGFGKAILTACFVNDLGLVANAFSLPGYLLPKSASEPQAGAEASPERVR